MESVSEFSLSTHGWMKILWMPVTAASGMCPVSRKSHPDSGRAATGSSDPDACRAGKSKDLRFMEANIFVARKVQQPFLIACSTVNDYAGDHTRECPGNPDPVSGEAWQIIGSSEACYKLSGIHDSDRILFNRKKLR